MPSQYVRFVKAPVIAGLLLAAIATVSGGFTILSARPLPIGDTTTASKTSLGEIYREAYCVYAVRRLSSNAGEVRLVKSPDANTRIMSFGPEGRNIARCEFLPIDQTGDVRISKLSVNQKRLHPQIVDAINMRIDVLEYRRG
ncbi:hypothetical protein [Sinorhizobium sp. BG8]|uniref:hypothetical protein n=1 Tax=Sinorhizobium sp. BG8 TaxID=2613773 RepID=UPI00193D1620|nr:hypothetical protein [Sinorhizobium sp. BG8]QRM54114.1 hypothetical protein F3Y30_05795 [Sinorhizobium sp. BG8]